MKVALVGLGYWGKIIYKSLSSLDDIEIVTCDVVGSEPTDYSDYKQMYAEVPDIEKVFVVTPATNHFEVCEYFLNLGVDVFCEKPLCPSITECDYLFDLAERIGSYLFVDWIFTHNEYVDYLKKLVEDKTLGNLKSMVFNRLNLGPVRRDISSKYDLASHDVSIITKLTGNKTPNKVSWVGYKRDKKSTVNDSCIGLMSIDDVFIQINASWHYMKKDRFCVFEFEGGVVEWDDSKQSIRIEGKEVELESATSPLIRSITSFLKKEYSIKENHKNNTKIMEILNYENTF